MYLLRAWRVFEDPQDEISFQWQTSWLWIVLGCFTGHKDLQYMLVGGLIPIEILRFEVIRMAREPRQQNTVIHVVALVSQIWLKYLDRRRPYIRFCV